MAEEANEDSWLYGSNEEQAARREEEGLNELNMENELNYSDEPKHDADQTDASELLDTLHADFEDAGESRFEGLEPLDGMDDSQTVVSTKNGDDDSDSDDDDDDINVVIGDIKSGANYNMKQRAGIPAVSAQPQDKPKSAGGKFNIEEFESVGTINGTIAHEFNVESIEDKPWRKPGSDITDYFNYGFNEDTWRAYCERQKKMRVQESGVGLAGLTIVSNHASSAGGYNKMMDGGIKIGINHRAGPPPFRKPGSIDVIGGAGGQMMNRRENEMMMNPHQLKPPPPKENVIQVMTADRREYSRTVVGNKFDMPPPMNMPPPSFNINPEDFYDHEAEALSYGGGYEPTQDSQWNNNAPPAWAPGDIKQLTGGFPQPVPPVGVPGNPMGIPMRMPMMPGPMGMNPAMPPNKMMIPPLMTGMDDARKGQEAERRRYEERNRERRDRERPADAVAGAERFERRRSRSRDRTDRSDRKRERSTRKERSRSRERSKRRSKSREKKDERASSSRRETSTKSSSKKSHKKDKEDSD